MSPGACRRLVRRCVNKLTSAPGKKIEPEKARGTLFLDPLNPKGANLLRHYEQSYQVPSPSPPAAAQDRGDEPSQPSDAVKQLDRKITPEVLSEYLLWQLYYDYCEPPPAGMRWYDSWESSELGVFIEMGTFFHQGYTTVGGGMEQACKQLGISWPKDVRWRLVRLANSYDMEQSELANTIENVRQQFADELTRQTSLQDYLTHQAGVVTSLTPDPSSPASKMRTNLVKSLDDYIRYVVQPQIKRARGDWLGSAPDTDSERLRSQKVNHRYLAVQLPRDVPLYPYGKNHHLSRLNPVRAQSAKRANPAGNPEMYHPAGHYGQPGMPSPPPSRPGKGDHPSLVARVGALPEMSFSTPLSPILPMVDSARPSSSEHTSSKPETRSNTTVSRISLSSREWIAKDQQPTTTKAPLDVRFSFDFDEAVSGVEGDEAQVLQSENNKLKGEVSQLERQLEKLKLKRAGMGASAAQPTRSSPTKKPALCVDTNVTFGAAAQAASSKGSSSKEVSPTTVGAQQNGRHRVPARRLSSAPISTLARKSHQPRHPSQTSLKSMTAPTTPVSGATGPPQSFQAFGFPPPIPTPPPMMLAHNRATLPSQQILPQHRYSTMPTLPLSMQQPQPMLYTQSHQPTLYMQAQARHEELALLSARNAQLQTQVANLGMEKWQFQQQQQQHQSQYLQRPTTGNSRMVSVDFMAAQRNAMMPMGAIARMPSAEMMAADYTHRLGSSGSLGMVNGGRQMGLQMQGRGY